jgi:hypothetical protein
MATDAQGWVHCELGDVKRVEQAYHRALALLDALVKDFPRVPRHRELLARAYNSSAVSFHLGQ